MDRFRIARFAGGAAVVAAVALGGAACASSSSGDADASPTEVAFGPTALGTSASRDVVVTNVAASGALTVESVTVTGAARGDFTDDFDDGGTTVLDPGESFTLAVTFAPTAAGERAATLTVAHSGPDALTVPLGGTGVAIPPGDNPLTPDPAALDFGQTTVGASADLRVMLHNGGTADIDVTSVAVTGPDAALFTIAESPTIVRAGRAARLVVWYTPTASGPHAASLVVTHTGTNTPVVVPLSGSAVLAAGAGVPVQRINAGGPSLPGEPRWAADGPASPSPFVDPAAGSFTAAVPGTVDLSHPSVPAGTPAELFHTERDGPEPGPPLAYAVPVPAGTPLELRLYLAEMFDPAAVPGARVFDVLVDGQVVRDDLDVTAEVGPHRALVLHLPVVSDGTVDVALSPVVGIPSLKGLELVTTGPDVPPLLAATPTALDLGPVPVRLRGGGATVQLTNVGTTGPLTVTGTTMSGPGAEVFADRPAALPVTLAPGQSTTVPVDVLPEAEGPVTATLDVAHTGAGGHLGIPLDATGTPPPTGTDPSFVPGILEGVTGLDAPTSLQFGPDGRLYLSQINGTIRVLTVARDPDGTYRVTAAETLDHLRTIPNHDDHGVPDPTITTRLVTGLLVTGTAQQPVVYAVSADPRIGAGTTGDDLDLDTNSGVLSRLTPTAFGWQKVDLVRGLPRSEENHTGNGLALDPATGDLLIAYGGHTNMGAPSHNFAGLAEYALSAAVLSVDLDAIGSTTYDLPTLDDQDRPGPVDAGDPFGGNDGRNQARLVPGGPVRVWASGFRNPYDLAVTQAGAVYTIDNGGNAGWGGVPQPDDATGACTNAVVEPGRTDPDDLFRIGPGFYGGHPNPTRANPANTFNPANPQSPVAAARPVECDYRNSVRSGALANFAASTNGLVEYTAGAFGGAMAGDLLAISLDQSLYRIELDPGGTRVTRLTVLASPAGAFAVDVTAQGEAGPFPGTIWVADLGGHAIRVYEPQQGAPCTGADNPALDEDGDGFDNADELANGTNPCSAASAPPDADGDHTSDRLDPDDDGDGLPDTVDRFARDPADGRTTGLPVVLTWDNDAPAVGGLLGLGFTGLMADGTVDYLDRFDPDLMTSGGAAGVLTLDAVTEGDALGPGTGGGQDNGFQLGLDVTPATGPFVVHTRLPAPFAGLAPSGDESYGLFVGDGSQDGYVKVVVAANGGAGGFAVVDEQGGVPTVVTVPGPVWPGPGVVDLFLRVDPAAATVEASVAVDGGPPVAVGGVRSVPPGWFTGAAGPAVGIISTSTGTAPPFPATWDFLQVQPAS